MPSHSLVRLANTDIDCLTKACDVFHLQSTCAEIQKNFKNPPKEIQKKLSLHDSAHTYNDCAMLISDENKQIGNCTVSSIQPMYTVIYVAWQAHYKMDLEEN